MERESARLANAQFRLQLSDDRLTPIARDALDE